MKVIGVTGGIASGKSVVVRIIQELGYPVFHSDQISHFISDNDQEVISEIKQLFGDSIYAFGKLDRAEVAKKVFNDGAFLSSLSDIIHPRVRKCFELWARKQITPLVFNESALLFETGSYKNFDKTILVVAPEELRVQRAVQRDNVSVEEIRRRMIRQWSDEQKMPLASFVIENDDKTPVISQVEMILNHLLTYSTSS